MTLREMDTLPVQKTLHASANPASCATWMLLWHDRHRQSGGPAGSNICFRQCKVGSHLGKPEL